MSDFTTNSTSGLSGDTNKYIPKEIFRGSLSITPIAQSTGFKLTGTIDLSQFDAGRLVPDIEVFIDDSAGGVTTYTKCPFADVDTSGNVQRSVSVSSYNSTAKGGGYALAVDVTYYNRTSATTKTFYYRMQSTEAGPYFAGNWLS